MIMSQHLFTADTRNFGKLDVLMGWDCPCQWFFLVIERSDEGAEWEDEPNEGILYSNLMERDPKSLTLAHFFSILSRFSIAAPDGLAAALKEDAETNSNRTVQY